MMSKDGYRECPDCAGSDLGALFGGKGNGKCSQCRGEGIIYGIEDAIPGIAGFDNYHTCSDCYGTGQCQTCGGTGHQYYYEDNSEEQYSETETIYDSSSSSPESSYISSPDYSSSTTPTILKPLNYKKSSGSSGILQFIIISIVTCLIIWYLWGSGYSNENNIAKQKSYVSNNSTASTRELLITNSNNSISNPRNANALDGKWIKIYGWSDKGIVVSFVDNIGKIISVPDKSTSYNIGHIEWKDYDPERNWLQFSVHLSDGYLNTEVKFINKDTIKLTMSGDIYARQRENNKSQDEKVGSTFEHLPVVNNQYGEGKGRLIFWTDCSICQWKIYINGKYIGYTKYYRSTVPDSKDPASVYVDLLAGSYKYIAETNFRRLEGRRLVIEGEYNRVKLSFP